MIIDKFVEFVSFPNEPRRITSAKQRLAIGDAVDLEEGVADVDALKKHGARQRFGVMLRPNDWAISMFVSDNGDVTGWSKELVWHLFREDDAFERIQTVERHLHRYLDRSDVEGLEVTILTTWADLIVYPGAQGEVGARLATGGAPDGGVVIREADIIRGDDVFEAMVVDELSCFRIWTKYWVFTSFLHFVIGDNMRGLPRNPPTDDEPMPHPWIIA